MKRFVVTPCNDYLYMSLGGSEKNRWFQLDVTISILWSCNLQSAKCVVFYSTCTMYACFRFIKWSNSFSNYHTAFSPTLYLWSTKVCLKIVCKSPDTQGLKATSRCGLRSTIFFDQYQTLLYVSNKKLLFAINFKTGNQTQTFPLITQTGRSYNVTCVFS